MRYPPIRDQKLRRDIGGLVLPLAAVAFIVALGLSLRAATSPTVRQVTEPELMRQRETDRRIRALESETTDLRTRLTLLENRNQ